MASLNNDKLQYLSENPNTRFPIPTWVMDQTRACFLLVPYTKPVIKQQV